MGEGLSRKEASLAYLEDAAHHVREGLADAILRDVERIRPLPPPARVFEIGVGTGWLLADLAERGYVCAGIELNQWNREYAAAMLRDRGIEADIADGSIESAEMGDGVYDLVVAESVFEHVPDYRAALDRIYRSLKPGGLFHMSSTNKFSPVSGEFTRLPFYGWLPRNLRLMVRRRAGDQVTADTAFFDWNQFTYRGLRRSLKQAGFTQVYDRFDLLEPADKAGSKRLLISLYKRWPALKSPLLAFDFNTGFCCVK
jgi:SAM-dependent methyltransferase